MAFVETICKERFHEMNRYLFPVVVAICPILTAASASAQTAEEMVKKAIQAADPNGTLKKVQGSDRQIGGKIVFNGKEVDFDGQFNMFLPDLVKNTMTMKFGGQEFTTVQILNGDNCKMTVNGMEVPVSDVRKHEMRESMHAQKVVHLYPLLEEKGFELAVLDQPRVLRDKNVRGILVKAKGHRDIKIYFDPKTFALAGMEHKAIDMRQKEVERLTIIDETERLNGVLVPRKMTILDDDKPYLSLHIKGLKYLEKVDKKDFAAE